MSDQTLLLATDPVSWAAHDGQSRVLGANPVEWRQPSGIVLTTDGWGQYVAPGPKIPDPIPTDDRHVNWAIYEDGTLVINGDNELVNEHGNLKACSNMVYSVTFPEPKYRRYLPVTLDNTMMDATGNGWWNGDLGLPSLNGAIGRVEFAKPTAPISMCGWFMNAPYLWEISSTNLNTSQLTNTSWMFPTSNTTRKTPFPIIGDWDVSNLMDASGMFMFLSSSVNIEYHPLIEGPFNRDFLGLQNWKVHDGCNTNNMFSTTASSMEDPSAWLFDIFCNSAWNCEGENMFSNQYNFMNGYWEWSISGEMATPYGGYFDNTGPLPEEMREMYVNVYTDFVPPFDWSSFEENIITLKE